MQKSNVCAHALATDSLSGEPLHVFKGQLPRSRVIGEPVHVLPELGDGVEGLLVLKGETANLVVDEAGHHLELHGSVSCQVHVLKEIAVRRAIQPSNQCEWGEREDCVH